MMFRHVIPECDSGTGQELVKELAKCSELEADVRTLAQRAEMCPPSAENPEGAHLRLIWPIGWVHFLR